MAITFLQLAQKILEETQRPLSVPEIWEIAVSKGYDKGLGSKGKTPWASLGAMLYIDVRDNSSSIFTSLGTRPKRFVLKSHADKFSAENLPVSIPSVVLSNKPQYLEKDLHPVMVYYGFYYLKAYLKTIQHNKSDKKGFGEWVHPDLVGCYFPFSDWGSEVVEVSTLMGNTAIKLFSFELKRELSLTNIRESFFQAVSNSSWANEGYLVAAEIDTDEDFIYELKRLSSAFGIGVILLDIEDPDSTEILLPAKSRDVINWETLNKLASINPDFRDFLKRIKIDITSREVRKEMYDKVLSKEELIKYFEKKKG